MSCDICGANDKPLVELLEGYQSTHIKQICPACEKVVNHHLSEVRVVTHNILRDLLKRFMGMYPLTASKGF